MKTETPFKDFTDTQPQKVHTLNLHRWLKQLLLAMRYGNSQYAKSRSFKTPKVHIMQNIIKLFAILIIMPLSVLSNEADIDAQDDKKEVISLNGYFGIGMDATPFLNFLGNIANNTVDNSLDFNDNTLYFRYFIKDNGAIRMNFNIHSHKSSITYFIRDDDAFINDPLSRKQVEDRRTSFSNNYSVRAGYQHFFYTKNRLKGFAGADVGYAFFKEYYIYEYGNIMNEYNPRPTSVINWNTGAANPQSNRRLENVDKITNTLLAGAFTGVEYIFLDVFAVGLEVGVLYGMGIPGTQYQINETMSGSEHVEETIVTGRDSRTRFIESTKPYTYGNIYLVFHF